MNTKTVRYQHGALLRGYQLSVGVPKSFSFFYLFFKPLKISFNFNCDPALKKLCVLTLHSIRGVFQR